ncbi:hypothetical protein IQ265_17765 [Nodosilinea sp. LEGE 06152]|uniref:hypothetical protein n=1 Tax=Nodosilinea sp. LEGE 06152 TaxID=2777966 RepID=UPI001881B823|nr:hypothetical protein [Nodosilinea sp. LEGE 06152]MBE9158664.1 hypothetical protein [Nodosilinea sp. LEGE 06152]
MLRILSTGTAFDIAATTGDAGQLGMAAEFDGYISDRIGDLLDGLMGQLMHPTCGATLGNFDRTDLFKGVALGGDRRWADRFPWFELSLRLRGYLAQGDSPLGRPCQRMGYRISRRYLRPLSQHSVSQH